MSAEPARIDRTLAALAEPHRRQVVDILSRGPRSSGELAAAVKVSPPVMSRHLRALRQGRLVEETPAEFDARVRIYRLRSEPMSELKAWLEAAEQMWSEQLLAFKAHLEATAAEEGR